MNPLAQRFFTHEIGKGQDLDYIECVQGLIYALVDEAVQGLGYFIGRFVDVFNDCIEKGRTGFVCAEVLLKQVQDVRNELVIVFRIGHRLDLKQRKKSVKICFCWIVYQDVFQQNLQCFLIWEVILHQSLEAVYIEY